MNKMYPLFSSSKGNSTFIGSPEGGVLVDAGVSCKKICTALESHGISPAAIKGILITHIHTDHVKGLKVLAKKHRIPIFAQNTNLNILSDKDMLPDCCKAYRIDDCEFTLGDLTVKAFETPHDAPASCGYKLTASNGKTAVVCTDLGHITRTVWENIQGAEAVLIEANYDPDMLKNGSYPFELKKRIASNHGHLSNADCGRTVYDLLKTGTKKFILGHLSQENNLPDIAENTVLSTVVGYDIERDFSLYTARPEDNREAIDF